MESSQDTIFEPRVRRQGFVIVAFAWTVPDDGFGGSIDALVLGCKDRFGLLVELGGHRRVDTWRQAPATVRLLISSSAMAAIGTATSSAE